MKKSAHRSLWRRARDEWTCALFGHTTKYAKRIHTEYFGMEELDVPVKFRNRNGNYMWAPVSSWSVKCKRCRRRWADSRSIEYPIYVVVPRSIFHFFKYGFDWKYRPYARNKMLWYGLLPITFMFEFIEAILVNIWLDTKWTTQPFLDIFFDLKYKYWELIYTS